MSKNFSHEELACPCCGHADIDSRLLAKVQAMRDHFGAAMKVNSAFRCTAHNRKVGGTPSSQHLLGRAIDISIQGMSAQKKHHLVRLVGRSGFTGIGIYQSFIHLDVRHGAPALWVGQQGAGT